MISIRTVSSEVGSILMLRDPPLGAGIQDWHKPEFVLLTGAKTDGRNDMLGATWEEDVAIERHSVSADRT
jgi:hypothetical protein